MNAIEVYAILKKKISNASSSILNKLANTDQNVQALSSNLEALESRVQDFDVSKLDTKLTAEIAERKAVDETKQDSLGLYIDEDGDICQR